MEKKDLMRPSLPAPLSPVPIRAVPRAAPTSLPPVAAQSFRVMPMPLPSVSICAASRLHPLQPTADLGLNQGLGQPAAY
uniref:Uncharacterized protein n=1 Tax=Oryza australiensis TaxID=4532 RepID=A0A1V1H146_9ORYZ|nr:hypothetical protein [Oryza australiensis]